MSQGTGWVFSYTDKITVMFLIKKKLMAISSFIIYRPKNIACLKVLIFLNLCDVFFSEYDRNYDMFFNHPQGNGFAWIPFPIQVRSADFISVSLWVRYSRNGGTGVYLTQFVGYVPLVFLSTLKLTCA